MLGPTYPPQSRPAAKQADHRCHCEHAGNGISACWCCWRAAESRAIQAPRCTRQSTRASQLSSQQFCSKASAPTWVRIQQASLPAALSQPVPAGITSQPWSMRPPRPVLPGLLARTDGRRLRFRARSRHHWVQALVKGCRCPHRLGACCLEL